jgi:hypothetical protein
MDISEKMGLAEMANAHRARMRGMSPKEAMRYVREVVAGSDLVYGVWSDPDEDDGVGTWLVKGRALLQRSVDHDVTTIGVKTTAVPCDCPEQAVALQQVLGDPTEPLSSSSG